MPSFIAPMPSLINVSMSEGDVICNKKDTNIDCDSSYECSSSNMMISDTSQAPICCRGWRSCWSTSNMTVSLNGNNNSTSINSTAIRCDGGESCEDSENWILSTGNSGNIYMSGGGGGSSSQDTIISTMPPGIYDIFCTGEYACQIYTLKNANNLYCTASDSCINTIISNVNNVFAYGYRALYSSTSFYDKIVKNIGNIYCGGYQSCQGVTIYNVMGDVYGNNERALYNANISDVTKNVIGMGPSALYGAVINNATNVCCLFICFACAAFGFGTHAGFFVFFLSVTCLFICLHFGSCTGNMYSFRQLPILANACCS